MQRVVDELLSIHKDVGSGEPSLRELMAAGAFLASFYNGVENILKRISVFNGQPIPSSPTWHFELFDRFVESSKSGLPVLFDDELAAVMDPYRRFRHIVRTTYGIELDWDKVIVGIDRIEPTFERFRNEVTHYLKTLS